MVLSLYWGLSLSTQEELTINPPSGLAVRDPDSGRNTVASRRLLYGWYIESQPPACHHNSVSGQGKANLINAPAAPDDDLFLSRPLADQHIRSVPQTLDYLLWTTIRPPVQWLFDSGINSPTQSVNKYEDPSFSDPVHRLVDTLPYTVQCCLGGCSTAQDPINYN